MEIFTPAGEKKKKSFFLGDSVFLLPYISELVPYQSHSLPLVTDVSCGLLGLVVRHNLRNCFYTSFSKVLTR